MIGEESVRELERAIETRERVSHWDTTTSYNTAAVGLRGGGRGRGMGWHVTVVGGWWDGTGGVGSKWQGQGLWECCDVCFMVGCTDKCVARRTQGLKPHCFRWQDASAVVAALRKLFGCLMNASAKTVETSLAGLISRIESTSRMLRSPVDELALRLHAQYPNDVGVFCVYLLNYKVKGGRI